VFEPTEGLTPPYFYQEIIGQFGMVPGLGAGGGGYDPKVAWAFGESGFKCCKQPGGKCPSWLWNGAWTALNFAIDDPFYFHYMYTSSGTEREATFTASAFGDLDCDDEWSTYERTGSVDSAWHPVGGGGLYVNNDIE
jgi:hypothetical protein